MIVELTDEVGESLAAVAEREELTPAVLIEKLVLVYRSAEARFEADEEAGRTFGELLGQMFDASEFKPSDISANDEYYLRVTGFGESNDDRRSQRKRKSGH